jgi:hypothetical protein
MRNEMSIFLLVWPINFWFSDNSYANSDNISYLCHSHEILNLIYCKLLPPNEEKGVRQNIKTYK